MPLRKELEPGLTVTREALVKGVSEMLRALISSSTVNDEVVDQYADRIIDATVIHIRQGKPTDTP